MNPIRYASAILILPDGGQLVLGPGFIVPRADADDESFKTLDLNSLAQDATRPSPAFHDLVKNGG